MVVTRTMVRAKSSWNIEVHAEERKSNVGLSATIILVGTNTYIYIYRCPEKGMCVRTSTAIGNDGDTNLTAPRTSTVNSAPVRQNLSSSGHHHRCRVDVFVHRRYPAAAVLFSCPLLVLLWRHFPFVAHLHYSCSDSERYH
jgi:hypothetical protein